MYGRTRFEREMGQLGLGGEHEVLDPGATTRVDSYLRREKDWPQWKVLAHVTCGALEAERQGRKSPVKKADEILKKGDRLHIADPLPAACVTALQQPAAAAFRDYAFCPGVSSYDDALKQYFDLQPQTLRLKTPTDLAGFIKTLIKGTEITHPIRHIILAGHAHAAGLLGLRLNAMSKPVISQADLDSPSTASVLDLPAAILTPRPKDPSGATVPATVHIKGCRVGDNKGFLTSLKNALGGRVVVTAPKHFHFFRVRKKGNTVVAIWEYMSYDFTITSLNPLTRDQAVDLYVNRKPAFTLIGSTTAIARATWESWIPAREWGRWRPRAGDDPDFKYIDVPVDVIEPIGSKTDTMKEAAAVRYLQTGDYVIPNIFGSITDPKTTAARKAVVKSLFVSNPDEATKLQKKHNLASLDELMAGDWRFEPKDKTDRKLAARLYRHEYTVMRPVVDQATNTLFMNIMPPQSRTDRFQLLETDARFFGTA